VEKVSKTTGFPFLDFNVYAVCSITWHSAISAVRVKHHFLRISLPDFAGYLCFCLPSHALYFPALPSHYPFAYSTLPQPSSQDGETDVELSRFVFSIHSFPTSASDYICIHLKYCLPAGADKRTTRFTPKLASQRQRKPVVSATPAASRRASRQDEVSEASTPAIDKPFGESTAVIAGKIRS